MQSPLPIRLKNARKLANMTQEQLSTKLGFDRSHGTARISQYETGKHAPDYSMAKRMADVLGVPVAYLFCDDEALADMILAAGQLM
ncbi:helix-turn-helix domain-containing protein [Marinomonas fungiae]|uniref:Helix-turn-helix domain n=1 Tax=Marinomonas fungiae TaxID=1137284 RepID=A0A0K6IJS2_9GAMM|nr:helix-turn-helix transcriptional regulator [Marinomonas fungiae]CUB03355.1 Helix-turn-helix domain [Marinomonas fungiae]